MNDNKEIFTGPVPVVERGSGIDPTLYVGMKIKLEKFEIVKETNFYPDGQTYNPNSTEKMWRCYIYTEILPELNKDGSLTGNLLKIKQDDGSIKEIRVRARFNLLTGKDGNPEISKHPKADLWKFMSKKGALTLEDLKGKIVILDAEKAKTPGDERMFLRIVQ